MTGTHTNGNRIGFSPELAEAIESIAEAGGSLPATLTTLRAALQERGVTWSRDGELLFPQDRTALVIEVDDLIDARGPDAAVTDFIAAGWN